MLYVNTIAGIAQLVEHKLPKLGVAGSSPVARSSFLYFNLSDIFKTVMA